METDSNYSCSPEEEITYLVEEYQLSLLRLCYAYLHDQDLAEDAVQETFLKAYRKLEQFRGKAGMKTWLSAIAINCCRDIYRESWFKHVNRSISVDILPIRTEEPDMKEDYVTIEVMKLPIRLREAVLLYYFEDMNTQEIAETLKISQQAVSSRLQRARTKLQKALDRFERSE
jgi:RNA polymerase sigma-70 factor (ECF subfamily)